jgi:glycosyltransferase involved in cell wall biosynthesis
VGKAIYLGEKYRAELEVINEFMKVSVIIATKNEEEHIADCLASLQKQTMKADEVIVVDNHSSDKTVQIAKQFTKHVYIHGNERSMQRNFGARKAIGDYILFLDADMVLTESVVEECIKMSKGNKKIVAIIIPEESIGEGFWAQCKALEKSYYIGNDDVEAPRFFNKKIFLQVGGYDENLISAEDWELSQRIRHHGILARVKAKILHNEGRLSLTQTIEKKYYYAQKYRNYEKKISDTTQKQQTILSRYSLFFSHPQKLFANPILGLGMLFMKTCEFGAGALGYLTSKIDR